MAASETTNPKFGLELGMSVVLFHSKLRKTKLTGAFFFSFFFRESERMYMKVKGDGDFFSFFLSRVRGVVFFSFL